MKTATFLRRIVGWQGDARLYRLSDPHEGHEHVVVSAVVVALPHELSSIFPMIGIPGDGAETYIFGASPEGDVRDYGELSGSFRGALDHAEALRGAGYEVVS